MEIGADFFFILIDFSVTQVKTALPTITKFPGANTYVLSQVGFEMRFRDTNGS